jgi:potassium/chloride transporter 9
MFTGIMQGANLSVDMKNPNRSIPMGTLAAVNSAALTYLVVAIALAGSLPRAALHGDQNILINSAMYSVYPVFIGVAFSAASSTLGNLYGASKVLDAMAQDELLGVLKPFKGRIGRAPRAAVALTWVLAQATVCAGKIDDVAPILTSIFLLAWAVLNLTCAILTSLGTPNFRPRWKYFSKRTAACGFAISFGIALFLDWRNTLVGIMLLSVLTTYLVLFAPAQVSIRAGFPLFLCLRRSRERIECDRYSLPRVDSFWRMHGVNRDGMRTLLTCLIVCGVGCKGLGISLPRTHVLPNQKVRSPAGRRKAAR